MSDKHYVLDYYVFVSRRGDPPNPWVWEIRRKSNPNGRYFWAEGFRSARAAEEAGKIVLAEVQKAALEESAAKQAAKSAKRRLKMIERMEMAVARIIRHTPQRRSELARIAAYARAKALSRERRSAIGRKGGAASKGKPKIKKHHRAPTDS
jgi:general stress protein YciG